MTDCILSLVFDPPPRVPFLLWLSDKCACVCVGQCKFMGENYGRPESPVPMAVHTRGPRIAVHQGGGSEMFLHKVHPHPPAVLWRTREGEISRKRDCCLHTPYFINGLSGCEHLEFVKKRGGRHKKSTELHTNEAWRQPWGRRLWPCCARSRKNWEREISETIKAGCKVGKGRESGLFETRKTTLNV